MITNKLFRIKLTTSLLLFCGVLFTNISVESQPNNNRQIVVVSEKKHQSAFKFDGLDTYDNPISIDTPETFLLRFSDKFGNPLSGYLPVDANLYYETRIGREFTRDGDTYFFCRPPIDGCNSFK